MNEATLFYSTITLFGIIYIILALLPKKHIASKTDYFLAGRNLGLFKATCTLIATQLGAGLLLGTSQQAYHMGLYSLLFTFGISGGLILLGCGLAGRLRAMNIVTTTQIFELKYKSSLLRKLASLLVTFTLCGILAGNIVASRLLMQSLGFDSHIFFVIFWLFIIVYTMVGGLNAVALTDIVQVLFVSMTFVGLTLYSLWEYPHVFSLDAIWETQQQFGGHLPPVQTLFIMLFMPAAFALFEQDLAQIFFACKTRKVATWTAIITTLFMLTFGLIPIYLGMQTKLLGFSVMGEKSPLLTVVKAISNSFVLVMVASGILAAIASTADALLCAIGSNITQDFSLKFLGLSTLVESKGTVLVIGLGILGLSYVMPTDIIGILVRSYEVPVSCLFIPILAAYFSDEVKKYAGIGGFLGGALGYLFFHIVYPVPFESLYALGLSLVGFIVGCFV